SARPGHHAASVSSEAPLGSLACLGFAATLVCSMEDLAGSPKAAARAAFLGVQWCGVGVRVCGDDVGVVNRKGRDKSGYSPL
ncbi:hypothetical protein ACOTJS_18005, partial [Achromobacter xylosoxidans]